MTIITERERAIAALVAQDLSDAEIADQLGFSAQHVKNTLMDLRERLGARSRVGVALAYERGELTSAGARRPGGQPGNQNRRRY